MKLSNSFHKRGVLLHAKFFEKHRLDFCVVFDLVLTGVNFNFSLQRMSHAVDRVLSYTWLGEAQSYAGARI